MRSSEIGLACLLVACGAAPARVAPSPPLAWTTLESGSSESLRGLSVPSPEVIWASGAHGAIVRSIDGGASWTSVAITGTELLDFRSLHAFDADRAVVLSAGSPARAFVTTTGGQVWMETYTRMGEGVFFDSLVFADANEGFALGDPMPSEDGPHFALLVTHDGGVHWEDRVGPPAAVGEAAFAASNACIALLADGATIFASGGASARTLRSTDRVTWSSASVPIASSASAGIFALAFRDARVGYAIGGDYAAPAAPGGFARTSDGGATWTAGTSVRGYRSSLAVADRALIAVGTTGSDVSYDEGASWTPIDDTPLHTVRVLGGVAFAVGPVGTIVRMSLAR